MKPGGVLLIQPQRSFARNNVWRLINRCLPPIGLASLAAVLEQRGVPAQILDLPALGLSRDEVVARLRAGGPAWVGITSTTVEINGSLRLASLVKETVPGVRVILGGAHPTAMPEEVAAHPAVDLVVRGEGEDTLAEVVSGGDWVSVQGITYRAKDGSIVNNPPRPVILDLSRLPMPAYHLLPMANYRPSLGNFKRLPAMSMVTTRGCPGRCTYCSTRAMGERIRMRDPLQIADEIERLVRQYGIREISFYDDTISWQRAGFMRLLEEIVRRRLGITWSCMSRVDMVDAEMLKLMRRAGCHQVGYGIESASPEILKNVKKRIDLSVVPGVVRDTRQAGLDVRLMFMLGNPGETKETMEETLRLAIKLDPDIYVFNITVPFPGTEMFAWARDNGHLTTMDWDLYDLSHVVMRLPTVEPRAVEEFYRHAYRKAYLNPRFAARRAAHLLHPGKVGALVNNVRFLARALWRGRRAPRTEPESAACTS